MTALDRTAYPVLRKAVSAQELHESFTLSLEEVAWVRGQDIRTRLAPADLTLSHPSTLILPTAPSGERA